MSTKHKLNVIDAYIPDNDILKEIKSIESSFQKKVKKGEYVVIKEKISNGYKLSYRKKDE